MFQSLRSRLILLLVGSALALTAAIGWLAYATARDTVHGNAARLLEFAAATRQQELLGRLQRLEDRGTQFVRRAARFCATEGPECLEHAQELARDDGIRGVVLRIPGRDAVIAGELSGDPGRLPPGQSARAGFDERRGPYLEIETEPTPRGWNALLRVPADTFAPLFLESAALGETAEMYLVDPQGYLLTPVRRPTTSGYTRPLESGALRACLQGKNSTEWARDYSGENAILSYRALPEAGGGCVVAQISAAEAYAPARGLAREVAIACLVFLLIAVVAGVMFAELLVRPIQALTRRVVAMQSGDLTSPIRPDGPAELRVFAETFSGMAAALSASQAELSQREAHLRALVEGSPLAIITADLERRITTWNRAAEQMFGWTAEEVVGRPLPTLPHEHRDEFEANFERVLREGRATSFESRRFRKDGTSLEVSIYTAPLRDAAGANSGVVAVVSDITARKQAEHALAESEAKFRAVAETAVVAIYIHDGERLLYVNPAAEEITGYTREELLASDMWKIVHPEDLPEVAARARARFRGEPAPNRYEYRLVAKNGETRWVDFGGSIVEFAGKRCVLATALDITERRRAEEALRVSEKLATAGRMAAAIAHEINNPLEAVTNLLYLIENHPEASAPVLELARMAQDEMERVSQIARQTLAFYREPAQASPVRVTDLVASVVGVYGAKIASKRLHVVHDYEFDGEIVGLSGELRQVFSNLLVNAIDACPEQGTVRVRVHGARDWKDQRRRGVRVSIADNGAGIAPETLRRIFEPFFTTKGTGGTGLGLWVTQGIVQRHGGYVRVRSSTDPARRGTVFSVFLPERAVVMHPAAARNARAEASA